MLPFLKAGVRHGDLPVAIVLSEPRDWELLQHDECFPAMIDSRCCSEPRVSETGSESVPSDDSVRPMPVQHELFGVPVSATTYCEASRATIGLARRRAGGCVAALPAHGIMTAVNEPDFGEVIKSFDIVCPDGQSVRFALNVLHKTQLLSLIHI